MNQKMNCADYIRLNSIRVTSLEIVETRKDIKSSPTRQASPEETHKEERMRI